MIDWDWIKSPISGQYMGYWKGPPERHAYVRQSSHGWDYIIQDVTGRLIERGSADSANAAKAIADA